MNISLLNFTTYNLQKNHTFIKADKNIFYQTSSTQDFISNKFRATIGVVQTISRSDPIKAANLLSAHDTGKK